MSQIERKTGATESETQILEETCGICLEDTIVNPIIFSQCKHAFCFSCLVRYQHSSKESVGTGTTCPYCRSEIPDIVRSTKVKVCIVAARAAGPEISEEEREALVSKALADIQEIQKTGDMTHEVTFAPVQAELMALAGKSKDAVSLMQRILPKAKKMAKREAEMVRLLAQYEAKFLGRPDPTGEGHRIMERVQKLEKQGPLMKYTDFIDFRLLVGALQQQMGDYKAAAYTYQTVTVEEGEALTAEQQLQIFMSSSECAYHLKNYGASIAFGEVALQLQRQLSGSHKYLALAHKANGNLSKAREFAAKGILYEAPWDDANAKECWRVWREVNEK